MKIFLSGGVTREDVIEYRDCVDAFGVGGAIANAPVIDFAMDIVEIGGEAKAKRGKRSGVKQVYAQKDGTRVILPASRKGPEEQPPCSRPTSAMARSCRTPGCRKHGHGQPEPAGCRPCRCEPCTFFKDRPFFAAGCQSEPRCVHRPPKRPEYRMMKHNLHYSAY